MNTIIEMIEALAVQTKDGDLYGDSLIQQLRSARYASTGTSRPGAAAPRASVQLNIEALTAWENFTGELAVEYSAGVDEPDRGLQRLPEAYLMKWGIAVLAAVARHEYLPTDEAILTTAVASKLKNWIRQITNVLDPLSGSVRVECPVCGLASVEVGEGELKSQVPALAILSRRGEELVIGCRNPACAGRWVGDQQVIQLGGQTGQPIDPDAIRVARQAAADWDASDDVKGDLAEPFDPTNPAHAALRQAAS